MRTCVFCQIPHSDGSRSIAADNFTLVGMDHNVVGWRAMIVASLNRTCPSLPNLHGAILRARHHPFSFAMKGNACDVSRVALKRQKRVRIRRFDVIELDRVVASGGEKALVGGDA